MSNFTKLMQQSAAGSAGGAGGLNVEDVFSTYLYTGTGATQTITNGIDLAGEGGLVWVKSRSNAYSHFLLDTERGTQKVIQSNATTAQISTSNTISAFNSDGWTMGDRAEMNQSSSQTYASWTFRKAPKFFDVVTYTGTGVAGRTISHNLGSVPGCIIIKRTDSANAWNVYHRGISADPETDYLVLSSTAAAVDDVEKWNDTAPTSTEFTVGNASTTNASGGTYVAYLFAHNDGDGDFGPTGDQDIIKCGSYTGNGSTDGPVIDLGFEPQWVMIKSSSLGTEDWVIFDNMRGVPTGGIDQRLYPSTSGAESANVSHIDFNATGFKLTYGSNLVNSNTNTYIYIAIRRGPMAVPDSATDVFDVLTSSSSSALLTSDTVTTDALLHSRRTTAAFRMHSRLTGQNGLSTYSTAAESDYSTYLQTDEQTGFELTGFWGTSPAVYYSWKRAPSFFDAVAYTGTGSARTVSHNLGVAPEMIWVKNRTNNTRFWAVYSASLGTGYAMELNGSTAPFSGTSSWNGTAPTSSVFTVNTHSTVNESGANFIAYLFASLDGISKVGSYTGNGSTQTINCGFSSGARFVLIKRTDSTGDWYVWDAERGIVSANDPHLSLNTTAAEVTTDDSVDPVSSGFAVNQVAATNINVSSASYIYYAVA